MPGLVEKFVSGRGLLFYHNFVKNLISESGMGVTDITESQAIPQLTTSGSQMYHVNVGSTTITRGNSALNLPTPLSGSEVFILDICNATENATLNVFILFDTDNIYIGKAISGSNPSTGVWNKISGESPFTEVTFSEYANLSSTAKNNGQLYLVTTDDPSIVDLSTILSVMVNRGEVTIANLPVAPSTHDFYFVTDIGEGRYYDGSAWKRVL